MICNNLIWSLVVLVLLSKGTLSAGSAEEDLPGIELLFSSSSPSANPQQVSPLAGRNPDKRAIPDMFCKGVYDRGIFMMLERVCEDCYNLYRKPYVAIDCRKKCYRNLVFRQCLNDLLLKENLDSYANSVRMVGK